MLLDKFDDKKLIEKCIRRFWPTAYIRCSLSTHIYTHVFKQIMKYTKNKLIYPDSNTCMRIVCVYIYVCVVLSVALVSHRFIIPFVIINFG